MINFSKYIGATLIIAGTTIGAGMLALPMTSAHIGFTNSSILLILLWGLMCFSALVTLEINLYFNNGISISGLAEKVFGTYGKIIGSVTIVFLFYSLLTAYITGSASLLKVGLKNLGIDLSYTFLQVSFTAIFGFFVYMCMLAVDYLSRFLFLLKTVVFFALIIALVPYVQGGNLTNSIQHVDYLYVAIPVFFTSFGFHGSIPPIINYIGPNAKHLRWIFIIGSIIPLIIYILWQIVTLGTLPLFGDVSFFNIVSKKGDVGSFVNELSIITRNKNLLYISNIFSFLAITTSFLGVSIGLFDYLIEILKKDKNLIKNRFNIAILTFSFPLCFSVFYPEGFVVALGYAAIALSILAVLLPILIAINLRLKDPHSTSYRVFGGMFMLILALIGGTTVILVEILYILK